MKGDPTTTVIEEGGRTVITHCFFDVTPHGPDWSDRVGQLEKLGCDVELIENPRLNFRVVFPTHAIRGTGVRSDMTPIDIIVIDQVFCVILRPHGSTTCRTLVFKHFSGYARGFFLSVSDNLIDTVRSILTEPS